MSKISLLILDKNVIDKGVLANVGLVLGLTAGKLLPDELFGPEVVDGDGSKHTFLTNIGHNARKAGQNKLKTLRDEFLGDPDVLVVDYTEDAAPANYQAYAASLREKSAEQLYYRAIYFYGPEEKLAPRTKNLSRL